MRLGCLFQRESGVDAGDEFTAGGCGERLQGIVALFVIGLAYDYAAWAAHGQAASADGFRVQCGPGAGCVPVEADSAAAVRRRGKGLVGDFSAYGVEYQICSTPAGELTHRSR